MAALLRQTTGVACTPMPGALAARLGLPPMVVDNRDPFRTAFTVSVDAAAGVSSGISATDRATTVRALASDATSPSQLTRPGHIFPLIARDGGVLARDGHTEAAVDLCRLAGLPPVGVICEVCDQTTYEMLRLPALAELAVKLGGMPLISIADLQRYRLRREVLLREVPIPGCDAAPGAEAESATTTSRGDSPSLAPSPPPPAWYVAGRRAAVSVNCADNSYVVTVWRPSVPPPAAAAPTVGVLVSSASDEAADAAALAGALAATPTTAHAPFAAVLHVVAAGPLHANIPRGRVAGHVATLAPAPAATSPPSAYDALYPPPAALLGTPYLAYATGAHGLCDRVAAEVAQLVRAVSDAVVTARGDALVFTPALPALPAAPPMPPATAFTYFAPAAVGDHAATPLPRVWLFDAPAAAAMSVVPLPPRVAGGDGGGAGVVGGVGGADATVKVVPAPAACAVHGGPTASSPLPAPPGPAGGSF